MENILKLQIPFTCITLYLGDIPETIMGNDRYLFKVFTAAAKKAVTHKWFQTDPPTVDNWLEIMKDIQEMKRLTFALRLQTDSYILKWTKWTLYTDK